MRLTTEILKLHICPRSYPVIIDKLRKLSEEVVRERDATTIASYIHHRNSVGSLTAELSYLLICPALTGDSERLCDFMKQVGAIGCLIDSLIDLHKDRRLGLLAFQPTIKDYSRLVVTILRDGSKLSIKHSRLFPLFLRSILDNLIDPIRSERPSLTKPFVAEREEGARSVA